MYRQKKKTHTHVKQNRCSINPSPLAQTEMICPPSSIFESFKFNYSQLRPYSLFFVASKFLLSFFARHQNSRGISDI